MWKRLKTGVFVVPSLRLVERAHSWAYNFHHDFTARVICGQTILDQIK